LHAEESESEGQWQENAMKQLQNFLAPLLILGLMLSSMSSGTSDQKEVISVHYFAKSDADSSASLFWSVLFIINNLCSIGLFKTCIIGRKYQQKVDFERLLSPQIKLATLVNVS
jgi:hypothetical protein